MDGKHRWERPDRAGSAFVPRPRDYGGQAPGSVTDETLGAVERNDNLSTQLEAIG